MGMRMSLWLCLATDIQFCLGCRLIASNTSPILQAFCYDLKEVITAPPATSTRWTDAFFFRPPSAGGTLALRVSLRPNEGDRNGRSWAMNHLLACVDSGGAARRTWTYSVASADNSRRTRLLRVENNEHIRRHGSGAQHLRSEERPSHVRLSLRH